MSGAVDWDVQLEGRAWVGEEAMARYQLTPEKFEMYKGKLFWDDEERMALLGCLLETSVRPGPSALAVQRCGARPLRSLDR